jgi:hypothetical protein
MFSHALPFSGVPTGTLDMTADLAPLLIGMGVLLGICILGFAFAIGVHDTWWARRRAEQAAGESATLPKAA